METMEPKQPRDRSVHRLVQRHPAAQRPWRHDPRRVRYRHPQRDPHAGSLTGPPALSVKRPLQLADDRQQRPGGQGLGRPAAQQHQLGGGRHPRSVQPRLNLAGLPGQLLAQPGLLLLVGDGGVQVGDGGQGQPASRDPSSSTAASRAAAAWGTHRSRPARLPAHRPAGRPPAAAARSLRGDARWPVPAAAPAGPPSRRGAATRTGHGRGGPSPARPPPRSPATPPAPPAAPRLPTWSLPPGVADRDPVDAGRRLDPGHGQPWRWVRSQGAHTRQHGGQKDGSRHSGPFQ